ncbi:Uncharacterised protein [Niallia circulans]|jgi:hypothetical protein|nr:Uncharacterised protein [Niallia circulans]
MDESGERREKKRPSVVADFAESEVEMIQQYQKTFPI